jgi:hypothetical protein
MTPPTIAPTSTPASACSAEADGDARARVCSAGGGTPTSALEMLKDAVPPHDAARRSVKAEKLAGSRAAKKDASFATRLAAHEAGALGGHESTDVTADVIVVALVRPVAFVTQGAFALRMRCPLPMATAPALPAAADESAVVEL